MSEDQEPAPQPPRTASRYRVTTPSAVVTIAEPSIMTLMQDGHLVFEATGGEMVAAFAAGCWCFASVIASSEADG